MDKEEYDFYQYPYTAFMNMGIDKLKAQFPFVERGDIERILKIPPPDLPKNCTKEFAAKVKEIINKNYCHFLAGYNESLEKESLE